MRKIGGGYRVILNDSYLPQIEINPRYKTILEAGNNIPLYGKEKLIKMGSISDYKTKDTKKYVEEKLNSAKWLIKGIEQRKKTIYRIPEGFFRQRYFIYKTPNFKEVSRQIRNSRIYCVKGDSQQDCANSPGTA